VSMIADTAQVQKAAEIAFEKWISAIPMHVKMSENMQATLRAYFIGGFVVGFRKGNNQKEIQSVKSESGRTA
jgi:hypothetical protein